ncbi:hypothetical protein FRC98_16930 [Lujinxingia vulgaris]|uniref:Uncharacterized protein n=1 Tax=Lujinxingia vulgaris TaxID=2600176 RepID=A0A5C6X686_9DELT|nr:hypothetical protein [Lujinxingia vulgaris]TXD35155.1 hypothetical protein FRC98_16930 [Lujinxingia vulgaris]
MNSLPLRTWAIALLWIFCVGCDSELTQECDSPTDCDTEQTCLGGRCELTDTSLPDVGEDAPPSSDCRVDPCADGLLCNATTGACENCTLDEQCDEYAVCHATERVCTCRAGYVRCDGQCVSQDSVESCGSQCQPCPEVAHGEPICVQQTCSASCDEGYFLCEEGCDGPPGTCVECLDHTHCTDPLAPVCNRGSCAGCASNQDCADVDGKNVCDLESGTCVECQLDQAEACGTFSCDPQTGACTDTSLGSRTSCESCRSDAECASDHVCVAMNFQGSPRNSAYCLRVDRAPTGETDCQEPFTVLDIKESITTAELEIVCGVNEAMTTCEAVLDYDSGCAEDDDCGAPGLDDGLCEPIEFEGARCTFPCDTSLEYPQCYSPFSCATGIDAQYCGAY